MKPSCAKIKKIASRFLGMKSSKRPSTYMLYHMKYIVIIIGLLLLGACKDNSDTGKKVIEDLPFAKAESAKAYADLIIKSIRTNRDRPIYQELTDATGISADSMDYYVSMYSTGIGGRDDWEYIDVAAVSDISQSQKDFDYAWLDPSGRLGIQIKVVTAGEKGSYALDKLELRSRLDVMKSRSLPGGAISNYEKIDYDWDADLKRKLEAQQK